MNSQILVISMTAASIGFIHTLLGPDHYLPFVVLSKARKWKSARTLWITILCGIGHIGGSVVLGFLGIAFGIALSKLQYFESVRGNIAGWLIIFFGLGYSLWGLKKIAKNKVHTHSHLFGHSHAHDHHHEHVHEHTQEHSHPEIPAEQSEKVKYKNLTPWLLFLIFVFGPCEPLIPMLMFPASQHNTLGVVLVTSVFGLVTIVTMVCMVTMMNHGLKLIKLQKLEKYAHVLAGTAIFFSGLSIQFLNL